VRRAQLLEDELQAGKRQFPFEKVSNSGQHHRSSSSTSTAVSAYRPVQHAI
jgi:hypothetical protein